MKTGPGYRAPTSSASIRKPQPRVRRLGHHAPAHGFTLFEMLVVILLIGVAAAAVAVSASRGLDAQRVRAAGTDVAAALRYTRTQAIVKGTPQVLTLDVRARRYQVPGKAARALPDHMDLHVTSAREDQQGGHVARIRFFPDGSSTGGHVVLRRGARQWRINVAWLTGAVSIETGDGKS